MDRDYPQPTKLIGIMGYARSGKDTLGLVLRRLFSYKRIAFGDVLRSLVDDYCGDWGDVGTDQYRSRLVAMGDALRRNLGANVLVDHIERKISQLPWGTRVVITDIRYPEEAVMVANRGGSLVRVTRPGVGPVHGEERLNGVPADFTVENSAGLRHMLRAGIGVYNAVLLRTMGYSDADVQRRFTELAEQPGDEGLNPSMFSDLLEAGGLEW